MIEDDTIAQELLKDKEAKVGFKTEQDHFYGYKSHLTINSERFITAIYCTPGNKADGNYLAHLIMESMNNGMTVDAVLQIGLTHLKKFRVL